ncbi:MAG TPA: isoprenylcysteine carboxylmethyltransferase family protein [Bryobacteraceae bacterium]|nr:isoprenylcysteine carboxylmethyltransferase family protein [Bryobacteraceae bacterium]
MRRAAAILGSALFLVIAPGTIAGLVPWWISRWKFPPAFPGQVPLQIAGMLLIVAALPVLLDSFARFALEGFGTPAPVFPTRRLIVTGLYRYVRNPMYVAVFSIILGQALLFGNVRLLEYGALVWLAFHLFVLLYEEPAMRRAFPQDYAVFCKHVPRWIPRLTPWRGDPATSSDSRDPDSTAQRRR